MGKEYILLLIVLQLKNVTILLSVRISGLSLKELSCFWHDGRWQEVCCPESEIGYLHEYGVDEEWVRIQEERLHNETNK